MASSFLRNRIINGDMRIDQRNAGASVTPASSIYTLDRWNAVVSQSSRFSVQQSSVVPATFTNSMLATSLTSTAPSASDFFALTQYVEGFNGADLGWGTANAQTVTLSFRVRSSLTGTFVVAFRSGSDDAAYPATYTINAANTWETKTITVPGPTSGTFGTGNGRCFGVWFVLGMGSNFHGTANAWAGGSALGVSGAVNVVATNGATFYLTGVQLEVGTVATPFERRQYGQELALCQRYYEKSFPIDTAPANGIYSMGYLGYVCFADQWVFAIPTILFKVVKRAAPTISFFGTPSNTWQINDNNNNWQNYAAVGTGFQASIGIFTTGFSAGVHNNESSGYAIGSARMIRGDWAASSEL